MLETIIDELCANPVAFTARCTYQKHAANYIY